MKLIRCQKCGTAVISEETFLQNIMDAMEDTCRKARRAKYHSEKNALLQEAAEYRSMYKAFMHHLTERDRAAHNVDAYKVSELYNALVRTGRMSTAEFQAICAAGEEKARIRRDAEDKELNAIYGCYETVCNRTMPSPHRKSRHEALQIMRKRERKNHHDLRQTNYHFGGQEP